MLLPADADLFRVPLGTGASMHVARYGYGDDAIVLLHGFGTSSFLWRHVGPLLAVQGARAFALDLFGYGESDRPFDAEFGLDAQSGYLDAAMTALQLQRATVVGMDVGALVALRLAFDRPERIYRLVLVGPPPLEDLAGPEIRELQRDTAKYALRLSRGLFGAESLLRPFLQGSVANQDRMPWQLLGRYLAPYLGADGANHLLALAGALKEDEFADVELRRLRQRTLIVRGTRDRWCTRGIAEAYADQIPRAIYQHVDEVGHLVPEEDASTLARLILAFVRTREDG
ncbi:MAG: alpha/beta hydrolase [Cytophagaceae bacterium]|nr:alpha/beta hydrolase [Gemmatimonadaceae bacterium]